MEIPIIGGLSPQGQMINAFAGYNHTYAAGINEFYEMENLSLRDYPMLSTRKARGETGAEFDDVRYMVRCNTFGDVSGKIRGACCAVYDGGEGAAVKFIGTGEDGGGKAGIHIGGDAEDTRLVAQAGYIYAFPQGRRIGAITKTSAGSELLSNTTVVKLNADYPAVEPQFNFTFKMWPCDDEGNTGDDGMPKNYIELSYSAGGNVDGENSRFIGERNGVRQKNTGGEYTVDPFEGFEKGDCIEISGISKEWDATYVIFGLGRGSLILNGAITEKISKDVTVDNSVSFRRRVPEMDYVVECGNRLWGCRYGVSESGTSVINEIYASALGEPQNWYKYEATAKDSWTATIGVDGKFTGAAVYGGYPVFFKENAIIRVWGSMPSNFQTAVYNYRGVKAGSSESLVICDEVLYYHSIDGILAYTGGVPTKVDDALGDVEYKNAAAGSVRGLVYVSMEDTDGKWHLFAYDTRKGLWHREDSSHIRQFMRDGADMYMVTQSDGVVLAASEGTADFEWYGVTGIIGYGEVGKKRLKTIKMRASLPLGSEMSIQISYDGGCFEDMKTINGRGEMPLELCFIPKRCDRFRLRLSGRGACRIISVYFETESA